MPNRWTFVRDLEWQFLGTPLTHQTVIRINRDYPWDGYKELVFSKIPTALVGWGKEEHMEGNTLKWFIKSLWDPLQAPTLAPNLLRASHRGRC